MANLLHFFFFIKSLLFAFGFDRKHGKVDRAYIMLAMCHTISAKRIGCDPEKIYISCLKRMVKDNNSEIVRGVLYLNRRVHVLAKGVLTGGLLVRTEELLSRTFIQRREGKDWSVGDQPPMTLCLSPSHSHPQTHIHSNKWLNCGPPSMSTWRLHYGV